MSGDLVHGDPWRYQCPGCERHSWRSRGGGYHCYECRNIEHPWDKKRERLV